MIVLASLAVVVTGCGSTIKPEGAAQSVTDLVSQETGFTPKDTCLPRGRQGRGGHRVRMQIHRPGR